MKSSIDIKIYGNGGGGVVTAAKVIATALIEGEKKSAQMFPTFGPERSGAPVTASIRITERPVPTPIETPDLIIVFKSALGDENIFNGLHENTGIILDTPASPATMSKKLKRPVWCVNASRIAKTELRKDFPGIALFGAFVKATGLVSRKNMFIAIRENFPAAHLRGNLRSAHRGYEEATYSGDMMKIISVRGNADQKPDWEKMVPGAVLTEGGNAKEYLTGGWGKTLPVIDLDKCKLCMICWAMCPDNSFKVADGKLYVDEAHCKGCGVCEEVCPKTFEAITMSEKKEIDDEN